MGRIKLPEKKYKITSDLLDLYSDVGRLWKDSNFPNGIINEGMTL